MPASLGWLLGSSCTEGKAATDAGIFSTCDFFIQRLRAKPNNMQERQGQDMRYKKRGPGQGLQANRMQARQDAGEQDADKASSMHLLASFSDFGQGRTTCRKGQAKIRQSK